MINNLHDPEMYSFRLDDAFVHLLKTPFVVFVILMSLISFLAINKGQ